MSAELSDHIKGKCADGKPVTMLNFKALSTVFRELRAPELEAAQAELEAAQAEVARLKEELALANARLDEADHEVRCSYIDVKRRSDEASKLRRKACHLERDNKALEEQVGRLLGSVKALSGDNIRLCEILHKRRRKESADAAA